MSIVSLMHESFRVDDEAKRLDGEADWVMGESFCLIDDAERLKWHVLECGSVRSVDCQRTVGNIVFGRPVAGAGCAPRPHPFFGGRIKSQLISLDSRPIALRFRHGLASRVVAISYASPW